MVLTLECGSESPGGLVKHMLLGSSPRVSDACLGETQGCSFLIGSRAVDVASLGTTPEAPFQARDLDSAPQMPALLPPPGICLSCVLCLLLAASFHHLLRRAFPEHPSGYRSPRPKHSVSDSLVLGLLLRSETIFVRLSQG